MATRTTTLTFTCLPSVPHATLTAYVVTATDQITDPAARAASATPALAQPQPLASDENMQLPVALLKRAAPAGTTLNVLVAWTPDDAPRCPPGAQVMFTPAGNGCARQATATVSTDAGSVYDALQSVAAATGVTVIADVPQNLPAPVTSTVTNGTPAQALTAVASQAGMTVHALNAGTFLVSADK